MQYRTFGKSDWKPSALGFGAMRLPQSGSSAAQIDEAEATRMLYHAIDQGVNYVDTAWMYHRGESERFLGRVLKGDYRRKVKLATKMPTWMIDAYADFDKYWAEQTGRLQTDHIDIYLLHTLDKKKWPALKKARVLEWAQKAMAAGRFDFFGFSFHDDYDTFQTIVDDYDGWDMCQIQYNYLDTEYQAGTRGLRYAASKGLAVVVMEPIRGGRLAANQPPEIQAIWEAAPISRTPPDWALQWVWNQPEVSLALSGMSTFQQVQENVASADRSDAGTLSPRESAIIDQVVACYKGWSVIPCTGCQYCMPCPNGVDIPEVLARYNDAMIHRDVKSAAISYSFLDSDETGDNCIQCNECLDKCPQHIEIPDWMAKTHALLGR